MTYLPYYDREGEQISRDRWIELWPDLGYRNVSVTAIDDEVWVSTVWLGIDHSFGTPGPPIIFETMIFGGPHDQEQWRYSTEAAALAGHDQAVALASERSAARDK